MSMHDLLGLDPADFVAARDRLARELKAGGDKAQADAIRALRRPSVPIWALNQVARRRPSDVDHLLSATETARSALEAGGDELREALRARREAMRAVVHRARDVVDESGRSGSTQEREIELALNTVIDSAPLTEALQRGELTDVSAAAEEDDLTSMFAPLTAVPTKAKPKTPAPASAAKPKPERSTARDNTVAKRAAAQAEVDRLEVEHQETVERRAAAERAVTDADAEVERAREAARFAQREADSAKTALTKATTGLERARRALAKLEG